jgi:creatinine amidohydrolase
MTRAESGGSTGTNEADDSLPRNRLKNRVSNASRSRPLLSERMAEAAAAVARVPERLDLIFEAATVLPRVLVSTGIGTSEGHARHLAEVATRWFGQPARFASTGTLVGGAPPDAQRDWLIVFSQGLSPNARHAFDDLEAWGRVLLITGVAPSSSEIASEAGSESEASAWLSSLEARGVIRIDLGCGTERGMLIRVIGARVGYAVAWSLLRTIQARRLAPDAALSIDPDALRRAQVEATDAAHAVFPDGESLSSFFDRDRTLLLVAEGGMLELAEQLSLKLAEGMLRPQPRCVDVLEFAHGPLQSLAAQSASILYLVAPGDREQSESSHDARSVSKILPESEPWLDRLAATLDPSHHSLRVLRAQLPWPFAVLEFEAMLDACVLGMLDASDLDLIDWPGADREAALYRAGPTLEAAIATPQRARAQTLLDYEAATWPEIGAAIAGGRRTALVALGSIEQHGPHLPLGTDRWIAQALAEGLGARLEDAIALPALAIGCASEHLDFAGTLHIEPATLEAVLRDLLVSLARHGFERAFVFTAHGGNVAALEAMQDRLARAVPGVELRVETDLRVGSMQAAAVSSRALDPASAGPHAGEFETSLVAKLRPGSVREQQIRPGRVVTRGSGQNLFYPSLRLHTETGVLGDPSQASSGRGDHYLEAWLDLLETAYREGFGTPAPKKRK